MNSPEQVDGKLWRRIPPLGMLAFAAFVVCALTGIMLVPAYMPGMAMDSLALLLLKNPAGVFVRSLHYWSAQAFLVLTLAHVVDYLLQRSETRVSFGVWLRLSLTIPVTIGAMLSGFLLRGDAPAIQALQILRSLRGFVPLIGITLSRLLTGSGSDLQTVYLHHACTATLIIWLVTADTRGASCLVRRRSGGRCPRSWGYRYCWCRDWNRVLPRLKKGRGIWSACRRCCIGCRGRS